MESRLLDLGCSVGALLLLVFTLLSLPHRTWQNAPGDADIPNVEEMLEVRGYDRNFRPGFGGQPLLVDMSLSVASIDRVSEVDMDYTLTIFLREYWKDERLHFSETNRSLSLDGRLVERLWVPDTFLVNAKSSFLHKVTVDNRLLRLFPDGSLLYGLRITAKAACPMDLRKYPLDVQTCPLQFESYGYTTEDIRFRWKDGNESIHGLERIELAQFWVGEHEVSDEVQKYETGEYPRLTIRFKLYRNIMYFILQTYLPATLLVVLSWVSFWINHEAVPARVALGITTVLTMTTFITSARDSLPKISYIKAIDVYCVMCFLFVFAALLEYAAVNYHSSVRQRREQKVLKEKKMGAEDAHKNEDQGRLGGLLAALKRKGFENGPDKSDEQTSQGFSVTIPSRNTGKNTKRQDADRQSSSSPSRLAGRNLNPNPWSKVTRQQENVPLNVLSTESTRPQSQSFSASSEAPASVNDDQVCLNIPTIDVTNQSPDRRRSETFSRSGRNSGGSTRTSRQSSFASTASPRGSIARMIIDYARDMEEKGMDLVPKDASAENVSAVEDETQRKTNDELVPVIKQPESHLRVGSERRRAVSTTDPPTSLRLAESRLSLRSDSLRTRKLSGMGMAVLNAAKLQKEANERATAGGEGRPREQQGDSNVRKRPVSFASLGQKVMKIQEEGRQDRKRLTIAEVVQRVKTSNIKLQVKDVNTIDKYSRIVFPGVFLMFCVLYWVCYAHS